MMWSKRHLSIDLLIDLNLVLEIFVIFLRLGNAHRNAFEFTSVKRVKLMLFIFLFVADIVNGDVLPRIDSVHIGCNRLQFRFKILIPNSKAGNAHLYLG